MDPFVVDEPLVRRPVAEQHPDLAHHELAEVDGGWEFAMWRLGDRLALRLPRWETSPVLLQTERTWLPLLAPLLPLPVPTPVRAGRPTPAHPMPWSIVEWVPGTPADLVPLTHARSVSALAGFLKALHVIAPEAAPPNPGRYGIPITDATTRFRAGLSIIEDQEVADRLQGIWDEAVAAPTWTNAPVWIHGDLIPANVVAENGVLCGVIDFGELCVGDPATDLEAVWTLLPDGSTQDFINSYGTPHDATIKRARA